jgi:hypothetical protein
MLPVYSKVWGKKSTFFSDLEPNLAKSSCGWSMIVHLPHNIEGKKIIIIIINPWWWSKPLDYIVYPLGVYDSGNCKNHYG